MRDLGSLTDAEKRVLGKLARHPRDNPGGLPTEADFVWKLMSTFDTTIKEGRVDVSTKQAYPRRRNVAGRRRGR